MGCPIAAHVSKDSPEMEFAFRLALELGVWDVWGMMDAMPAGLFLLWIEYASMADIGDTEASADWRAAKICETIANTRMAKKGAKVFKLKEFLPVRKRKGELRRPAQTADEMKAVLGRAAIDINEAAATGRRKPRGR